MLVLEDLSSVSGTMNFPVSIVNAPSGVASRSALHPLQRVRYQLLAGLFLAVIVPGFLYHITDLSLAVRQRSSVNTALGASVAIAIALYLYRRVASYPGVGILGYVTPAVAVAYGIVLTVFFTARLDYSRMNFGLSFAAAIGFFFAVSVYLRKHARRRFYVIPSVHAESLTGLTGAEWTVLTRPELPGDPNAVLIADLRADLGDAWERLIAEGALKGHPIYHSKQVHESLTGRVEVEHLSENSFGSLLPNRSYSKVKRGIDFVAALIVLPLLLIPGLIAAVLIKLDSKGPVFFRQVRRGYRGDVFEVVKFRTMLHDDAKAQHGNRDGAITQARDPRITRVGHFLRRTRFDEMPQVWNVLKGEMSWIGPRPEALALSEWYMKELPLYTYRHIVRPGITGWAQVNQGHVADLASVLEKLHYDFFYIKNFSGWLDLLIFCRTVGVVLSGHGAK